MRTEDGYIVNQCINGDSAAFGLLVDKYKASIFVLAYSRLRNFHDAEDITQEVFLKAYQKLSTLRRWDRFLAWLYVITSNLCRDLLRERAKRPDSEFIADQEARFFDYPSINSYQEEQLHESLHEALGLLPQMYREVLTLYYLGAMESKEIAQFLGTSPSAIRQRLKRARSKLKKEMLDMMSTTYDQQKLQPSFTFRIVEMVKHIKIQPAPRSTPLLPFGLSAATGIILTVLMFSSHLISLTPLGALLGSPMPSETKVMAEGELSVDVLEISEITFLAGEQGDGDGGAKNLNQQNAFAPPLAPQGEGGTWTKKSDMPTPRTMVDTCVVDGKIYAIGGCLHSGRRFSTVEVYDPETDTWTRKADMPTARQIEKSACVVNGKIYAIGGYGNGRVLSTVEVYDPKADTWTRKTDIPIPRCHSTACAINGKIYVIGGCNQGPNWPGLSIVEEYDPVTDTWTRKADMPTARLSFDTVAVNGRIYAIGGTANWKNGPRLSTMEEYDPATDTWARKADMSAKRIGVSAAVVNGKIYAIGGADLSDIFRPPEVYDPATDTWTELPDMQIPRMWLSSRAVNGKIYAIGGSLGQGNDNDVSPIVEEYTPEGWPFSVSPHGKLPTTWGEMKSGK